jgi:soluble lytic murein transglycosylase-like protein
MKKITLIIFALCLTVSSANSQTRTRLADNFDMGGGVQVALPSKPAALNPVEKKTANKTPQNTANTNNSNVLKSKIKPTSYSRITMAAERSMGNFTTGDKKIDSYIQEYSRLHNIDPLLIYAQMHQESSFKLKATSYKGASGLMQLMPATARRFGVTKIYDPQQNIEAGIRYMRWLINTFNGDIALALAGYNAGEGAVMKYGWQIPPYRETQEYVRRISARYNSIKNPNVALTATKISKSEVAELAKKETPVPLTVYERTPLTVRMADGRMRLVNQ